MKKGNLLIIDDNPAILNSLELLLRREFQKIKSLNNPNLIYTELEREKYDVILLDMNFKAGVNTGNEGIFWLLEIKKRYPEVEVIMITAYGDIELAVRSLKEGAFDFIVKPWDNDKLKATLNAACMMKMPRTKSGKNRKNEVSSSGKLPENFISGKSHVMNEIMTLVRKVASTDANILITGENGTGKEVLAREIHRLSLRKENPFIMVDLYSLAESLFESELFGHKKGAFTNAVEDKTGKFVLADKGTLFLDEIGNLPFNLQAKILTVLQTRRITAVGSNKEIEVDFRLVSATNKSLTHLVRENLFRQDLLYRMNTIQIHLPPLRERVEDIPLLVSHFLKLYCEKYDKGPLQLSQEGLNRLMKNSWPGNIRELQHTIEKAVILADSDILGASDFIFFEADDSLIQNTETLEEMEKKMIISTLKKNNFSQTLTAEQLGITRQTLYNKIKKYGI